MSLTSISFPLFGGAECSPPRSINIFGFHIYLYGIIIAIGFALAGLYVYKRRDAFGLTKDNVLDIFLCAVVGGIIGARLYYVTFNPTDYFGEGKWLNILRFRDGGLAVYGGIILGVISAVVYARIKKLNIPALLDAGGLAIPIGQAIGRWGNFINREAYGFETTVPWRMGLTYEGSGITVFVHPTFLYESLWNTVGFVLLHIISKRRKKYDGQIFLLYILWYGLGRFWIEGMRTDSLYLWGSGVRVSQALAILCVVAALILLIVLGVRSIKKSKINMPQSGETEVSQ